MQILYPKIMILKSKLKISLDTLLMVTKVYWDQKIYCEEPWDVKVFDSNFIQKWKCKENMEKTQVLLAYLNSKSKIVGKINE